MQEKVKNFNDNMPCHKKPMPTWARVADIQSELGELSKEILKASKYGTKEFELNDNFVMEFGDCLYSLMSLANELGIDANQALDKVLDKYQKRINNNNNMGSGR